MSVGKTLSTRVSQMGADVRQEFTRDRLPPTVFAGLVIGLIDVFIMLSFAALVFSGDLTAQLGSGIGYFLVGACALSLVGAFASPMSGVIIVPQDTTAALLSLAAANITLMAGGGAESSPAVIFATVVAVMIVSSLLTGLFFTAVGWFRLGRLVRFIPYPVIAGFLGGTGWLLAKGAVGLMTGIDATLGQLGQLVQPGVMIFWLPGLIFALVFRVILGRVKHTLVIPALILGALLVFYVVAWLSGATLAQASAHGWLLGPFTSSASWQMPTPALLAQADWSLVLAQAGTITAIVVISTVGLLLNASALELALKHDVKLDRELVAEGLGNLLAGLLGGPTGYQTLSLTVLGRQMGSRSRLVGVVTASMCLAALLVGTDVLALLPRFVFGGLVLGLGFAFLQDSFVANWSRLPRLDYAIVVIIVIVMAAVGVLEALLVGIALTVILFVIEYSRVHVVRTELSGINLRSRVQRSAEDDAILRAAGAGLLVLRLQGFLFFGTADALLNHISKRIQAVDLPPLRFLILDFKAAHGIDVSALNSFLRISHVAEDHEIEIMLSGLMPGLSQQVARMGIASPLAQADEATPRLMPDLDQAVEHWEEQVLHRHHGSGLGDREDIFARSLISLCPSDDVYASLVSAFERIEVAAGEVLIRQGDPADVLYFIVSGQMDVVIADAEGNPLRLRRIGPGAVVGEIGYYLDQSRSATIVASQPSVLHRLTAEALTRMELESPAAAVAFHRFIARNLAERVVSMNALVQEMQA